MIPYLCLLLGFGLLWLVVPLAFSDKGRRSFVLALRSLWLHKLRSFLSVLGIIIGTGAVIILMGFGEGSMQDALEDIKRQGATNIMIRSVKASDESSTARQQRIAVYGLTWADYERMQTIPTVVRMVPMRILPLKVHHLERSVKGRVVATTADYAVVNKVQLAAGRFLSDEDDRYMANVAVLGAHVADRLFPFENALGKTVRLDKYFYLVVGVLADRMATSAVGGSSQTAEDFNDDVYIPMQTCRGRFGEKVVSRQSGSWNAEQVELSQVTLTITDMESVRPAGDVVKDLLERYHGTKADWAITIPLDRLEAAEREKERFVGLLFWIGFISLFVGGIGIMNIMLATVTERTREIGIRRALGAKRRDITMQFLIEAVVQTSLGGMVGLLVGMGVVFAGPWVSEHIFDMHRPAVLNVASIFYSVGVALLVGVAFGLYPAWRASRLDPIEALRHE
ncbi:MAG: ABC transporter permease [Planctomycetes bacterium]|nr:ABC transporter permease [Planctomycetota bacterium]